MTQKKEDELRIILLGDGPIVWEPLRPLLEDDGPPGEHFHRR